MIGYGLSFVRFLTDQDEASLLAWLEATVKQGVVAIKLAQLCSSVGMVPGRLMKHMDMVLDQVPAHDWSVTEKAVSELVRLQPHLKERLAQIQKIPHASGSIAQVHLAGDLAIKIVHPQVDTELHDWRRFEPALSLALRAAGFDSVCQTVSMLLKAIEEQRDMCREAKSMMQFYSMCERTHKSRILIPQPFAATRDVLVMESILAPSLNSLRRRLSPDVFQSIKEATVCAATLFMERSIKPGGVMHCDLHVGNIGIIVPDLKDSDPKRLSFVFYDFGLVSEWDMQTLAICESWKRGKMEQALSLMFGGDKITEIRSCIRHVRSRNLDVDTMEFALEVIKLLIFKNVHMKADGSLGYKNMLHSASVLHVLDSFWRYPKESLVRDETDTYDLSDADIRASGVEDEVFDAFASIGIIRGIEMLGIEEDMESLLSRGLRILQNLRPLSRQILRSILKKNTTEQRQDLAHSFLSIFERICPSL
jgi:hypothetical protein